MMSSVSIVSVPLLIVVSLLILIISILNSDHASINELLIHSTFSRFKEGVFCLQFQERNNTIVGYGDLPRGYGQGSTLPNDTLCSNTMIIVNKRKVYSGFLRGTIGIGDTFFDKYWTYDSVTQDLGNLMTHLFWNVLNTASPFTQYIPHMIYYLSIFEWNEYFSRIMYEKNKVQDKKDVCYHYFDHRFFELMLDESMTYTSAMYNGSIINKLYSAQINKIEILIHKLLGQKRVSNATSTEIYNVLDIGSGWGFLPSYIDSRFENINVTGITVAEDQYNYYSKIYNSSGSPYYLLLDYRDIPNIYDAKFFDGIISVGVFEHIHIKGVDQWFKTAYNSLKHDSFFVMTTIISTQAFSNDVSKKHACDSSNYVNKYAFPGTCLLLLDWIVDSAVKNGFITMHVDYSAHHYAKTTRDWRRNLDSNKNEILKFMDEQKYLLFYMYLAQAEATFRIGVSEHVQIVFFKPRKEKIHTYPYNIYGKHVKLSWQGME
eukprot:547765_1